MNPCLSCGACCAFYRASFYWNEAEDCTAGGVPVQMTRKLNNFRRVMIGTEGNAPRCIALQGVIGHHVWCRIYERRPSVCREFEFSWEKNASNPRCDKARAFWDLTPITPEKGFDPKGFPMAA